MSAEQTVSHTRVIRWRFALALTAWSVVSMVAGGLIIWLLKTPMWEAQGWQHLIWGAIDLVFALLGVWQGVSVGALPVDDAGRLRELSDRDKLVRALKFNRGLNWGWVGLGIALLVWGLVKKSDALLGHGIGVTIQGGFLFFLDRAYLHALPDEVR